MLISAFCSNGGSYFLLSLSSMFPGWTLPQQLHWPTVKRSMDNSNLRPCVTWFCMTSGSRFTEVVYARGTFPVMALNTSVVVKDASCGINAVLL